MKKIVVLGILTIILTGCSGDTLNGNKTSQNVPPETYVNNYEDILEDEIMSFISLAELSYNASDSDVMEEMSETIVLAKVLSIEGGSNVNERTDEYVYPYTYGEIEIIEVYKGDVNPGDVKSYIRSGAIIPFDNYVQAMYPEQRSKFLANIGNSAYPSYVEEKFHGDINIETGKTYLMYLLDDNEAMPKEGAYSIFGFEGGLREIKNDLDEAKSSAKMVYNNFTKQWETLANLFE